MILTIHTAVMDPITQLVYLYHLYIVLIFMCIHMHSVFVHHYQFFNFTLFNAAGNPLRSFRAVPQAKMSSFSRSWSNSSLVKKLSKNTWWLFPLSRRVRSFTTLSKLLLSTTLLTLVWYRNSHCSCQQVPIPLLAMFNVFSVCVFSVLCVCVWCGNSPMKHKINLDTMYSM